MWTRRQLFQRFAATAGGIAALSARPLVAAAAETSPGAAPSLEATGTYTPVTTPNGATLPWKMVDGVKEFHLVAEPVDARVRARAERQVLGLQRPRRPGRRSRRSRATACASSSPTGCPSAPSIHWHGILLPNGMDGVGGLNQPHIEPGETYAYEFTLRQHGTHHVPPARRRDGADGARA